MNVRRAVSADLDQLRDLLERVELPVADLSLEAGPVLLAEVEGRIVACAGLEHYADVALLRSVAVVPSLRGQGIALRLCCEMLQAARSLAVDQVYLLTVTAPGFFEGLGFSRISRSTAPESIRTTREFRDLCPDTAVLMRKVVSNDATSGLATRLRDAYAAFLGGDAASFLGLLGDETVYHLPGAHLGGGRLEGRDAIVQRLVAARDAFDSPPEIALLDAAGDDAAAVTRERFRAQRRGRSVDQTVHVVWRFAQARCADIWAHFDDQRACDAFWEGWTA